MPSLNMSNLRGSTATAAGSTKADAASLSLGVNVVGGADDAKGVILPKSPAGTLVFVTNTVSGKALNVYPPSGGTIDAGAADAAGTIAGTKSTLFICTNGTAWRSFPFA